jgi:nickel-dependent lactate racemase
MIIPFGFYKEQLEVSIDDYRLIGVLKPNPVGAGPTGLEEVLRSLRKPLGSPRLSELARGRRKVVIVTSDITRPVPSRVILPPVLDELRLAGVKAEDITVVFALGIHRHHTKEEMRGMAGDRVYESVRCIDSDAGDCIHMGTTTRGTPVDIFRPVAEADMRICIGNIEYHYFAGYSGGAKALMPGVSSRAAIQANHSRMVQPEAAAGRLDGNPVRDDIDEVARFVPIDFIVNVVLDEHKNIIKSVAGDYLKAHRAGCSFLDEIYKLEIPKPADIVVVSAGGYPKDINLYQAQKALDNAKHAVRDGGIIILAAECKEGLGEKVFESWIKEAKSPTDMVEKIQKKFELGGHKAAAIAMVQLKADIYLVSDMDKRFVKSMFFTPFSSVQAALKAALNKLGRDSGVIVMPFGGSTLPVIKENALVAIA